MQFKILLRFSFIICIFFAFNFFVSGQSQFGIKVSGGLSRITNSINFENATLTTQFAPSGKAGIFYIYQFDKKSSLGAELLFSQIKGKEKLEMDLYTFDESGRVYLGYQRNNSYRNISYLSMPAYYGFKINSLVINAGFQISYMILNSGHEKGYAIVEGITYVSDKKIDNINIKSFDFGPKTEIIFNITKKLAFEGTYYFGLNNIQKGNPILGKLKVQEATLGIRYTLWNKETAKQ